MRDYKKKNSILAMNKTTPAETSIAGLTRFSSGQNTVGGRAFRPASLFADKLAPIAIKNEKLLLWLLMVRAVFKYGVKEAKWRKISYAVMLHQKPYDAICTSRYLKKQYKYCFHNDVNFGLIVMLDKSVGRESLKRMIASVQAQTYRKWELFVLAESNDSENHSVCDMLASELIDDARIHCLTEGKCDNLALANQCIEMAKGQYIAFLGPHDLLHPAALYEMAKAIEQVNAQFIYSDAKSFCQSKDSCANTFYKPDFSPDLLRSYNYISHLFAFSKSLMNESGGGLRIEYGNGAEYDLILRLTENADNEAIVHLQMPLCLSCEQSVLVALEKDHEAEKQALRGHLLRKGLNGTVETGIANDTFRIRYAITDTPQISIVIPNKDNIETLRTCLCSILDKSTWQNFEIIIVENNSKDSKTFDYYESIKAKDQRIKVVIWDGAFNYSQICNYGASFASGKYLLMLNNDTQVITPSWMEEMLMFAQRGDIGAVGAKLYYPNDTVQHGGVIIGFGGSAGHGHRDYPRSSIGYMNRLSVAQNVSAVTAACMLIPMSVWNQVNGFDKTLAICYNDVDLCLRIRKAGYNIVWTPFAELYHHEGVSQLSKISSAKKAVYYSEVNDFQCRWLSSLMKGDPFYNRNLSVHGMSFCARL